MIQRVLFACALVVGAAACNKPSEGDCKKAIANIRTLLGTDRMSTDSGLSAAWVRTCRGGAKKDSVQCAMQASTIDQLRRCGILKNKELDTLLERAPETAPSAPTTPPAAPTEPSAPVAPPTPPAATTPTPTPPATPPTAPPP